MHIAAVADVDGMDPDIQTRTVYLNGTAGGTPSTSAVNPTGLDRTSFGARRDSAIGAWLDGLLGYLAIWRVALLAQEVAALSHRVHPTLIRRSDLVAFWALDGVAPNRSDIGGYSLTNVGTPDSALGPLVAHPSPARAGKDAVSIEAAIGTPVSTVRKLRRPTSQHLKVYWYSNPPYDTEDHVHHPMNFLRGTAPLVRIKIDDANERRPNGDHETINQRYRPYFPKEAYDAVAHRMCDYIEAWNLPGCQWAFFLSNLCEMTDPDGNNTNDASLFRHWMDEVRGGNVSNANGRNSFYSEKGRAAVSTIASAIGRSILSVFQSRGLSSMLSPDLMEMFGDHESLNTVEAMLGTDGYFDFEQGGGGSSRFAGEEILAGEAPSYYHNTYNGGSPDYDETLDANGEFNWSFSNHWRPLLLMANEQAVKEAIVDPLRAAIGVNFKASNYAMFSATNPAHPYRNGGVRYGYAEYNTYPKHYLDYGQFALYPAQPEWAPKFGLGTIAPGDPEKLEELMLKMWWWNIRAVRGSGRPHIPTITYPGFEARLLKGSWDDPNDNPDQGPQDHDYPLTVSAGAIRKGYEMLVRAGHSKIIQFAPPKLEGLESSPDPLPLTRWDEIYDAVDRAMHLADQLHGGWRSRAFLSRNWR